MKDKRIKKDEAEERQEKYDSLSTKEKKTKLDKKLGKGIGAKKERAKLEKKKTGDKDES